VNYFLGGGAGKKALKTGNERIVATGLDLFYGRLAEAPGWFGPPPPIPFGQKAHFAL